MKVAPGSGMGLPMPDDAILLFDGNDLSQWHHATFTGPASSPADEQRRRAQLDSAVVYRAAQWIISNGAMVVVPGKGNIETRQSFGDVQLHIEWMSPVADGKSGQGYSNSGIFLMRYYEIQELNSYDNDNYPNGQAGAVYKQHIPLVNACRPPGEWQAFDIIFTAPRFSEQGKLVSPARCTVFHNGVLIHRDVVLLGATRFIGKPFYTPHPARLPLMLQDHGAPVHFRNIWIRELE